MRWKKNSSCYDINIAHGYNVDILIMKRRCRFAYPQSAHSSYFYYYCWYWRSSHDSDVEMRGLCSTFTHTSHYGWCQEGHLVKIASPCTSKASLCPDDRLFIQKPKVILAVIVAVANDNGYIGQFTKSNYCQSRWIDDEVMVYEVIIWFIEFDFFMWYFLSEHCEFC